MSSPSGVSFGVVKGSDPEQFIAVEGPEPDQQHPPGYMGRTTYLTEQELRDTLRRGGASDADIEIVITGARQHPV